jgi:hypothetical protein
VNQPLHYSKNRAKLVASKEHFWALLTPANLGDIWHGANTSLYSFFLVEVGPGLRPPEHRESKMTTLSANYYNIN